MNGLMAYSAIKTKISVMKGNLITKAQFAEIANLSNMSEMVAYLSKHPGYGFLLSDLDFRYVNRSALEELLVYSPCADFNKIYSFGRLEQKKFVDIHYLYFQIRFIKRAIRKLYNNYPIQTEVSNMEKLFAGHEKFDIRLVAQSTDIPDLISNLKGSIFYEPLKDIKDVTNLKLFDYELALDLFYFKTLWKLRSSFGRADKEILAKMYGKQIDMLNIMWVYRFKKYYSVLPKDLNNYLIPVHYKLHDDYLEKLVNSDDISSFYSVLNETYYGRFFNIVDQETFEYAYRKVMTDMHRSEYKKNPYSLMAIINYLYLKDEEVKKLITIAECIRYKYSPDKIISTLETIGGAG